jgi:hypothetical protein
MQDTKRNHATAGKNQGVAQGARREAENPISSLLDREPDLIRAILDTTGALVIVLDSRGRIVGFNRACERLTGYAAAELVGTAALDRLLVPEEIDGVEAVIEELRGGRFPNQFENHWVTKDGEHRLIRWSNTALEDSTGAVRYVIGTGIDITDRKLAKAALLESQERLRAILDAAIDAIIAIDARGTVDTFNAAAERMFGYRADEVIGRNVKMLMPAAYRREHDAQLTRYAQSGEAHIIGIGREMTGQRKDGSNFPIELTVTQVEHRGLFVGIVRDLTARKRREEEVLQSERLAAIGEAMAGLVHESRNALQRSQANLQRLAWRVEDQPGARELLAGIQEAQDHLHSLFEEVREFAAPVRLDRHRCHVGDTLAKTWEKLQSKREDREVRFRQHQPVALDLHCHVDPFAIGQVFRNILENSLAACGDPVEIEGEFSEAQIEARPALRIALRDNGPGLGPEQRARIFDSFYTTKTHGTGLGMAIAKRIVDAHGGKIAVGNEPKQGAQICITLPRRQP